MIQSILLILLVIGAITGIRWFKQQPQAARRKVMLRSLAGAAIFLLITLAVTGRMHWLFAVIGALIPFMRGALGLGIQLLPLWLRRKSGQNTTGNNQPPARQPLDLSIDEAMQTLGLEGDLNSGNITVTMVNDAHRRLIQKVHPDRGGNDFLASRVNRARDVLIDRLKV
ncbi:J domain-containing protein [Cellvibrio polysaccharolyticus]|uniref:Molecular chaperone DnaJ n=1 Tax=Cellvibrio polysaccharolyticus TaxID=2082724 RepID=A0A928V733_9GAMM|nr:molecular chaperone DnaJ [Cellvibrio polysaccharolyticus]MBE8717744.1 molecular chaperone DnaJ [Cellvibrio polysaccharolyticus]